MNNRALLTKQEVAKYMKCSHQTVERLVKNGSLRAVKIGRLIRFAEPDVDAFLQGQTKPAPT